MKLLIQAAMVFFATLLAAALVALGVPMIAELVTASEPPSTQPASSGALAFVQEGATVRPRR